MISASAEFADFCNVMSSVTILPEANLEEENTVVQEQSLDIWLRNKDDIQKTTLQKILNLLMLSFHIWPILNEFAENQDLNRNKDDLWNEKE